MFTRQLQWRVLASIPACMRIYIVWETCICYAVIYWYISSCHYMHTSWRACIQYSADDWLFSSWTCQQVDLSYPQSVSGCGLYSVFKVLPVLRRGFALFPPCECILTYMSLYVNIYFTVFGYMFTYLRFAQIINAFLVHYHKYTLPCFVKHCFNRLKFAF